MLRGPLISMEVDSNCRPATPSHSAVPSGCMAVVVLWCYAGGPNQGGGSCKQWEPNPKPEEGRLLPRYTKEEDPVVVG